MAMLLQNVIKILWPPIQAKQNFIMNFENSISISKEIEFFLFVWCFLAVDSVLIMTDRSGIHDSLVSAWTWTPFRIKLFPAATCAWESEPVSILILYLALYSRHFFISKETDWLTGSYNGANGLRLDKLI